jgi:hypothetical protein
MDRLVDELIRRRAEAESPQPPRRPAAPRRQPAPEDWLPGLSGPEPQN